MNQVNRRGPELRILVTNWNDRTSPYAGGADVHLHQVFGRLARQGHQVTLLSAGWKGAAPHAMLDGIAVHRAGGRHTFALAARRYFEAKLRGQTFDVVVEDLNKVPLLVHRWSRTPFVLLVHHLWGATALRAANPLIGMSTWASEVALVRAYRGCPVQAVSDSTAHDLVGRGIHPKDIRVITNGADRPAAAPATGPDPRPTLVTLGRLQPYKRVDRLFRVMARIREEVPDVRLLVVGDGADGERLRREADVAGVAGAVEFLGFVSDEVKHDVLARAWLNVIASEREGWGLTVVEAGAYGVPTVANDVPGLRDAVAHEQSGLLVPDGDLAAFAEAVMRLIRRPDDRARLGAGARRFAEYHTWERAAAATEEHLQEVAVLGRSRRGWEPLVARSIRGSEPWPVTAEPPLPYVNEPYLMLATLGDAPISIRMTLGSEDAAGFRPGVLLEGLPDGLMPALQDFSSAVEAVPTERGLLLRLRGWPARPARWFWEELGASLRGLRPRAVYRG